MEFNLDGKDIIKGVAGTVIIYVGFWGINTLRRIDANVKSIGDQHLCHVKNDYSLLNSIFERLGL